MSDDWLAQLGIHVSDLVAGFSGGIVNAFVFKRSEPWAIVGSVVVGSLTANYLSQPVGHYIGTSSGASSFIVGLAGMAICQGIVEAAKSWRPFNSNPKG
jgi:ABC-type xylose transport system permease subunit